MWQTYGQTPRVKELALESALVATFSVHRVANDRESRVREVRAYLMGPSGDRPYVKERPSIRARPPRRDPLEPCRGVTPAGSDDHPATILIRANHEDDSIQVSPDNQGVAE